MIKVALVTSQFPSLGQLYIADWAGSLAQAGISLTVLTEKIPSSQEQEATGWKNDGSLQLYEINRMDRPLQSTLKNLPKILSSLYHIRKSSSSLRMLYRSSGFLTFLRKAFEYAPYLSQSYDLVHFNAPQIAVRRFELGKLLSASTLVSFRGQDISFDETRYDALLEEADHLHFISEHLVCLAAGRGYAGNKHTLIPPMVDPGAYQLSLPHRHSGEPFKLFTAARLTWVKGWEFALQAVALLVQRGWDVEYEIAGDGDFDGGNDQRELVLYTIHELGLQDRVKILGWLLPEKVRERMQNCDLYLMPSVSEAFNNSVLQAQACGLPVICSDAGGLPENIEDGVTGLLFRRRDAWDMACKVESLLVDPEKMQAMGLAGRQRVEDHFSMKKGIQAFIDLYHAQAG